MIRNIIRQLFPLSLVSGMVVLTILYLLLFILDGITGVGSYLMPVIFPHLAWNQMALLTAWFLYGYSAIMLILIPFTPCLPKRILAGPLFITLLTLFMESLANPYFPLVVSAIEIVMGGGLLYCLGGSWKGRPGLLNDVLARPLFSWRHFFVTGGTMAAVFMVLLFTFLLIVIQYARLELEKKTRNYVLIQKDRLLVADKTFQRDKQQIRLIGMIHVARDQFYNEVAKDAPPDSIVLLEGVGDRKNILKTGMSYSGIAEYFGIQHQGNSEFQKTARMGLAESPDRSAEPPKTARKGLAESSGRSAEPPKIKYRRADLDVSDLSPETIKTLVAITDLLNAKSASQRTQKFIQILKDREDAWDDYIENTVDRRNEHLTVEIEKALKERSSVIVPWGAMHMSGIQDVIEKWGFQEVRSEQREAIKFSNRLVIFLLSAMDLLPIHFK